MSFAIPRPTHRALAAAVIGLAVLASGPVHAEEEEDGHRSVEIPDFPDNPTATLLSLDASKFVHPTTTRDLSFQLLNGYNIDAGTLEPGTAIEFAPAWLLIGGETTLKAWQASYLTQVASRTSISIASTTETVEDEETDATSDAAVIAASFRAVLLDTRDPRADEDVVACADEVIEDALDAGGMITGDDDADEQDDALAQEEEALRGCKEKFENRIAKDAGFHLALSGAYVMKSPTREFDEFESDQAVAWLNFAYGVDRTSTENPGLQVLTGVKYVASLQDGKDEQSVHGAVGLSGGYELVDLEARFAWTPTFPDAGDSQTGSFAAGGLLQVHASDDLTIGVDVGGTFGSDAEDEDLRGFLLVSYDGLDQRMPITDD